MKAELVQKTSKNGVPYVCIELTLAPDYKKLVFLTKAELSLLKSNANK